MMNEFKETVRKVTEVYGPSGRETKAGQLLTDMIRPYVDEIKFDALGNAVGIRKGTSGKKVMLSAHMDQIGLIVLDIDDKGFLRFAPVGGISPEMTVGRDVVFQNGTRGVVCREQKNVTPPAALTQMFIDIGCSSREEAEAHVAMGDICVYAAHFVDMGSRVACCALDDRICCAILVEAMKKIRSPHDIYCVFTSQEEVGCRGAQAAAYWIDPDFGINLDVTASADTPECNPMPMKLGEGPTIKYKDRSAVITKPVIEFMHRVADKHGIKVQNEVLPYGGTDASAVQTTRGGKPACCVSVATRYIHSPIETADLNDCLGAVDFVCAMAEEAELPLE
ncbi:MAG: M20/M25/M40 family metallo-hydrolase [Clostridia bacterium]|nr:M20/M25/M40 family metallo-hydrolase [Clostridia bacterium]MBR5985592.1 M20/M25/M40 family metallo-hydrolase [Clostridia bacterium]